MFTEAPFDRYEVVIGLECHVQLKTQTKLFSPARNRYGDAPNVNVDVIDIGLPGVLPTLNREAVDYAIRLGLGLSCVINHRSVFARKHYFYPDLPKGYQISQYNEPICGRGLLAFPLNGQSRTVEIERIHIEEDAGKNIHVEGGAASFVDYNRAGTPLLEVVSAPDMRSAQEAMAAFQQLRTMVMYLGICDGNLQEGSLRADVNVSVRPRGETKLGTRTETKNLNSIRYVGQAIEFESRRQILALESGHAIVQETRLWDPNRKESRSLRSKEDAHDYRYLPDPDLLPLLLDAKQIASIRETIPELPDEKRARFCEKLELNEYDAKILVSDKSLADYFESALALHPNAKSIANWIINDLLRVMKSSSSDDDGIGFSLNNCPIPPESIAGLVRLIDQKTISGKLAKVLFEEMLSSSEKDPEVLAKRMNLSVERDVSTLRDLIHEILQKHPGEVAKFVSGKTQVFGFFVGQAMKLSQGPADPEELSRLLKEALAECRPKNPSE